MAGINEEHKQKVIEATVKFAASHGFSFTAEELEQDKHELSHDELKVVAGGAMVL